MGAFHVFPLPPPGGSGGPKPSFMAAVEAAWSMEYLWINKINKKKKHHLEHIKKIIHLFDIFLDPFG